MYILNRETGKPVFGIDETPVPHSNVPGEAIATQPIPVKPPPSGRMSFKPDDLVTADDTNENTQQRARIWREAAAWTTKVRSRRGCTARRARPGLERDVSRSHRRQNWGGTASDPKLGYVFVIHVTNTRSIGWIEKHAGTRPFPTIRPASKESVQFEVLGRKPTRAARLLGEQAGRARNRHGAASPR